MNRLQSIDSDVNYFVTLNYTDNINPDCIHKRIEYTHPQYTAEAIESQRRLSDLNHGSIKFCGSYFGYGFHEDAVSSANAVAMQYGVSL